MCKIKSGIVLKDRIYIPEHNHHTQMLEELGIEDTKANAEHVFVRVELYPVDGNIFGDIDTWKLIVDQDIKPDWFFEKIEKPKIIAAVKEWAKDHVFVGLHDMVIEGKSGLYLNDCKNIVILISL